MNIETFENPNNSCEKQEIRNKKAGTRGELFLESQRKTFQLWT
jgi:hypothetical protein